MAVGTALSVGVPLAMGAFSAMSSIQAGGQQAEALKQQGEFEAGLYSQQAAMVGAQRKISAYQFGRRLGRARSSIVATTAGKGLLLSGTPVSVLIDTESQMRFDNAINDYNLKVQQNYYQHAAAMSRYSANQQAELARGMSYRNAFSSLLGGVSGAASGFGGGGGTTPGPRPDIFTSAGPGFRKPF